MKQMMSIAILKVCHLFIKFNCLTQTTKLSKIGYRGRREFLMKLNVNLSHPPFYQKNSWFLIRFKIIGAYLLFRANNLDKLQEVIR